MQIREGFGDYSVGVEWGNGTFAWFCPDELYLDTDAKEGVPVPEPKSEGERMKEFFFGKPRKLDAWGEQWRSEGRCPDCGELGHVHLSTFICSKHGAY